MKSLALLLIFALVSPGFGTSFDAALKATKKTSKSFSIFSVVQFGNSICVATSSTSASTVYGTCFTTSECQSSGGTATGSCASGFGVCCVITQSTCGSTISKNVTYIQNPGFPSAYTTAGTCTYSISTTSDICQLRLDFVNFVAANPTAATGECLATDRLVITSPSGSGPNASPPITCGVLTGQHMYVETARLTTPTTLAISNIGTSTNPARQWQIRVSQIECGSPSKAPTDCLQYYTGVANSIKSFNYQNGAGQMIRNLNYFACIRQEEGYCTIQYRQNDATTMNTFRLSDPAVIDAAKTPCTAGPRLIIPSTVGNNGFCGAYFSSVNADKRPGAVLGSAAPFDIGVYTEKRNIDDTADVVTQNTIGFFLNYNQIPC